MAETVHLDGMTLEGGGQLVRIALGISALTGIPLSLSKIRGRRHKGQGLKGQHVTSAMILGELCNASMDGVEVKSKEATFEPSKDCFPKVPAVRDFQVVDDKHIYTLLAEQQTNGCISLVLQALLPYVIFSGHWLCCGATKREEHDEKHVIRLMITGGTDGSLAPSFDYLRDVLCPLLSRIGVSIKIGGYRRDSPAHQKGYVEFDIKPLLQGETLKAFSLTDRGKIKRIELKVKGTQEVKEAFDRKMNQLDDELIAPLLKEDVKFEYDFGETKSRGSSVYAIALAHSENGYCLASDAHADYPRKGKRDKKSTYNGAVEKQLGAIFSQLRWEIEHGGCVDSHMRDQIAIFQALADGRSAVDVGRHRDGERVDCTLHARTAEWVLYRMLGVDFDESGACEGVALKSGMPYVQQHGGPHEEGAGEEKWSDKNLKKWGARVAGRVFPRQANCDSCQYWRLDV